MQNLRSFGWQAMSPSAAALAGTPSLNGFGGVAQLGEHLLCKQGVDGSNPFTSTSLRSCGASAGRPASDLGRKLPYSDRPARGRSSLLDIVNSLCDRGGSSSSRLHGWGKAPGS